MLHAVSCLWETKVSVPCCVPRRPIVCISHRRPFDAILEGTQQKTLPRASIAGTHYLIHGYMRQLGYCKYSSGLNFQKALVYCAPLLYLRCGKWQPRLSYYCIH